MYDRVKTCIWVFSNRKVASNFNNANRTVYVETNMRRIEILTVNKSKPVEINTINETDTAIEFLSNITVTNVTFTMTAITNQTRVGRLNDSASVDNEIAVGKIVEINVFGLNATNESHVQHVIVKLHYTKDDLDLDGDGTIEHDELDENNMFIYWFNTSGNWTKLLRITFNFNFSPHTLQMPSFDTTFT